MTSTHNHFKTFRNGLLLLAGLFCSGPLLAQKSPISVSLTGGISFPTGQFAAKDTRPINATPNNNGAARPGLNTSLQIDAKISSFFFITLTGGISKYNRDTDELEELYTMLYGSGDVKVKSDRWEVAKLLAGPSFRLPLADKLSLRTGIAAGIAHSSLPPYKIERPGQPTSNSFYDYDVDLSSAFAYQANAGLGFKVGQQLSLLLDVNYFGSKVSGTQTVLMPIIGPGPGPNPQPAPDPIYIQHKYPLNNISALIGLEWQF